MLEAHYIAPRSIRCGGFFLFWGQGFWQKDEVLIPSPTGGTLKESGSDGIIPPMQHAGEASKTASHQAPDGAGPLMLNSARRHCTSPRRGRRVEWSGQRRGIVRLHFRARLFCRRCACDASYESVGNAGRIGVTTTDKSLRIDSVKRCEG